MSTKSQNSRTQHSKTQNKLHVIKGDKVKVIAGKDKGLVGEIIAVHPETAKVTVQGVNVVKRHVRDSSAQPQGQQTEGGIISSEAPVHVSNVQLVVKDADGDEVVTRVAHERVEVTKRRADGTEYKGFRSIRKASKTGEEI